MATRRQADLAIIIGRGYIIAGKSIMMEIKLCPT